MMMSYTMPPSCAACIAESDTGTGTVSMGVTKPPNQPKNESEGDLQEQLLHNCEGNQLTESNGDVVTSGVACGIAYSPCVSWISSFCTCDDDQQQQQNMSPCAATHYPRTRRYDS
jgi:hypothetical protein